MADEASARRVIRRQALSIAVAVSPFGVAFGVACADAGLSTGEAMGFSSLMFTGGSQFAAVGVLGDGGSASAAIGAAVLLALRSLAYGVVLAPVLSGSRWWRALASQAVIDETMALATAQATPQLRRYGFVTCAILLFSLWNTATLVGVLAGSSAGDLVTTLGIDATIPASFLALVWPRLADVRQRGVAVAGAAVSLVLIPFAPAGIPILAASIGCVAGRRARPVADGAAT